MGSSLRREHLINTAIELFCEHGYHKTNFSAVCLAMSSASIQKKNRRLGIFASNLSA